MTVGMENYEIVDDAGAGFDVKVKVSLKQYRAYGTKTVTIKPAATTTETPKATVQAAPRPTTTAPKTTTYITATTDYLFDLAEFEVFGSRSYANSYEQNYQLQYDYYKAGNSKVAYNHSAVSTAVRWGLRSPYYNGNGNFCDVYADGTIYNSSAYRSLALRPGFAA